MFSEQQLAQQRRQLLAEGRTRHDAVAPGAVRRSDEIRLHVRDKRYDRDRARGGVRLEQPNPFHRRRAAQVQVEQDGPWLSPSDGFRIGKRPIPKDLGSYRLRAFTNLRQEDEVVNRSEDLRRHLSPVQPGFASNRQAKFEVAAGSHLRIYPERAFGSAINGLKTTPRQSYRHYLSAKLLGAETVFAENSVEAPRQPFERGYPLHKWG